jgi:hypothetical protein
MSDRRSPLASDRAPSSGTPQLVLGLAAATGAAVAQAFSSTGDCAPVTAPIATAGGWHHAGRARTPRL